MTNGGMHDSNLKGYVAETARAFAGRRIGKREFLRRLAIAGVGLSSFATAMLGGSRHFAHGLSKAAADVRASPEMTKWLQGVGSKHRGTKIRFVSEPTPPTMVAKLLAKDEFTATSLPPVDSASAA